MILVGNPMIGTSKVADMTDSKAIGRIIEVDTMEVTGVIKGAFIVGKMVDQVANMVVKMRLCIKIRMILIKFLNLIGNSLYFHPDGL